MLSHIMVGSNDIARSRNSTMLCLSQWALAGCRGRKWPATLHAQWRAFPPSMASRRLLMPMAARSASQWLALHRPTHGTKPASRMAVPRSRTGLACAGEPPARHISLIFAIPMATNCAPFIASQLPEYSPFKIEEGRPFRAVLAREGTLRGPVRALSWERSRRASDYRRPTLRISHCVSDSAAKPRHPPALDSSPA